MTSTFITGPAREVKEPRTAPAKLELQSLNDELTNGDPGKTRTSDTQFRKLLLYPPELRGHFRINYLRPFSNLFAHFPHECGIEALQQLPQPGTVSGTRVKKNCPSYQNGSILRFSGSCVHRKGSSPSGSTASGACAA